MSLECFESASCAITICLLLHHHPFILPRYVSDHICDAVCPKHHTSHTPKLAIIKPPPRLARMYQWNIVHGGQVQELAAIAAIVSVHCNILLIMHRRGSDRGTYITRGRCRSGGFHGRRRGLQCSLCIWLLCPFAFWW